MGQVDVLLIDDLALRPLATEQAADLLAVIEDRSQRRSTIVISRFPISEWHEVFGDPTLADAILDRLTSNAHRIELRGDSMRRRQPEGTAPNLETDGIASEPPGSMTEAAPTAKRAQRTPSIPTVTGKPGARSYYDRLRARGKMPNQALRAVANRLVGILHGGLRY